MSEGAPAGKLDLHKAFWARAPASRPLLGFVVGGWSAYRANPGWLPLQNRRGLAADEVDPAAFVPWIEQHLARMDDLGDDAIRAAQPFQAIPWLEGVVGCPLCSSAEHIWSEPFLNGPLEPLPWARQEVERNAWANKYTQFLDTLAEHFGDTRPIGQSILRGPADLASAALGEERFVFALVDEPEASAALLAGLTEMERAFIELQWLHMPPFHGGCVVGEFNLWAPQKAFRFQEDASALLSPDSYCRFVLPCDERLCGLTRYNVMHVHTTSLNLLDAILGMKNLGAVQISQDEGFPLERLLPQLLRVQQADKPLIVKGRFAEPELAAIVNQLSPRGLYVQPVVEDMERARRLRDACA